MTQSATVEVFLKAFKALSKEQQRTFLEGLLREQAYREDLLDVAIVEARRHESGRPLRTYLTERANRR